MWQNNHGPTGAKLNTQTAASLLIHENAVAFQSVLYQVDGLRQLVLTQTFVRQTNGQVFDKKGYASIQHGNRYCAAQSHMRYFKRGVTHEDAVGINEAGQSSGNVVGAKEHINVFLHSAGKQTCRHGDKAIQTECQTHKDTNLKRCLSAVLCGQIFIVWHT